MTPIYTYTPVFVLCAVLTACECDTSSKREGHTMQDSNEHRGLVAAMTLAPGLATDDVERIMRGTGMNVGFGLTRWLYRTGPCGFVLVSFGPDQRVSEVEVVYSSNVNDALLSTEGDSEARQFAAGVSSAASDHRLDGVTLLALSCGMPACDVSGVLGIPVDTLLSRTGTSVWPLEPRGAAELAFDSDGRLENLRFVRLASNGGD